MKPFRSQSNPLLLISLLVFTSAAHGYSQQSEQFESEFKLCQQSLQSEDKSVNNLPGCKQLIKASTRDNPFADYQLGMALITSQHISNKQKRLRRGLYALITAADAGHRKAIHALSEFVKDKMQNGKLPIRWAHLIEYAEKDWQQLQQPQSHHYIDYQNWLAQVEQSQEDPKQLTANQLTNIAIDYQNGYFLGNQLQTAIKLFKLAAKKGNVVAQYKLGESLYPTDKTQALEYLMQAANNQSSDAMLMLGDHYGCQGNKEQALTWYQKAIALGNEYAEDERQTLIDTGKPTQCD